MDPLLYQEMYEMESTHWWFCAKHAIVLSLLKRHLSPKSSSQPTVCDLGCGCGAMLSALKQAGFTAEGIDNNDNCAALLCQPRRTDPKRSLAGIVRPGGERL